MRFDQALAGRRLDPNGFSNFADFLREGLLPFPRARVLDDAVGLSDAVTLVPEHQPRNLLFVGFCGWSATQPRF